MKNFNVNVSALCGSALLSAVLTLTSCSSAVEEVSNPSDQVLTPVTVNVSDFAISVEDFPSATRAVQDAADYATLKVLTLAFYSGTTKVFESTQTRTDASTYTTFGEFSCHLPVGTYTLVAIGRALSDGDVFTFTSATQAAFTSDKVRETFCASQSVTVTDVPVNLSVTLNRVVAMLKVTSTDTRPEGATRLRTTFSAGGKAFNPTTGLATVNTGFQAYNTPTSEAGKTITINNLLFLTSDEQTMDITLEALDADNNVLVTKSIPDVLLKRNRKTTLNGPVFTVTSQTSSAFHVETDWLSETTIPFN